ncbi:uncharacterized protein LOC116620586 [Nematostella vectensis]|uniref:uncharacterized protein LOC116620586 n=1 Tax=Nematostella vectensis TaxID=45351 RepID=UPI0013900F9C|nr:uncharacterized protein LOC116620586 [Nematostella vectensis]
MMVNTKFRTKRRPVARGHRSRKRKQTEEGEENSTASAKKIRTPVAKSSIQSSTDSCLKPPQGYRFQDMSILKQVLGACAICKYCKEGTLRLLERQAGCGLARTLVLLCSNNGCQAMTELPTSKRIVNGKARFYDVNRRSALAMRVIGRGRAALVKFCAVMNMPGPVKPKSFSSHVRAIHRVSKQVAGSEMAKAVKEIRKSKGCKGDSVADISVSCDGTWARRGYQSLYGMVSAIGVETGKVVDYEVKSKVCYKCRAKKDLDPLSQEYINWTESHAPNCTANFNKSSKAMESAGAVDMWNRSVTTNKLQYTEFVGDGDCSSFKDVSNSRPYGAVNITKVECVGHIQKRMGGRLRRLKRDKKGQKLNDGKTIGGRNRLTDNLIDTFQRYYGKALRQNIGDVDGMERDVRAIWHHYASTEEKPQHHYCPAGSESWCKWQKDRANGTSTFKPKKVDSAVMAEVLPTFLTLCERDLLQSVAKGLTQNANESLNHLVWDICPKEGFSGPDTVGSACAIAVSLFNGGAHTLAAMLIGLHLEVGKLSLAGFTAIDQQRLYGAAQKSTDAAKLKRQVQRAKRKKRQDHNEEAEGPMYDSGAFGP